MFFIVLGTALVLFWLAFRERPLYNKKYFQSRSNGVFRTEFAPGFKEYLDQLEKEVSARFIVGPFSPTDDMLADLYHPEIEENWRRDLLPRWRDRIRESLTVASAIAISVCVAVVANEILRHRYKALSRLLDSSGTSVNRMAAFALGAAVCFYLNRCRNSISRTQGYLDGYSDRCAGPERPLHVIAPPSGNT